jgi:hypothetical protein
LLTKRKCPGYYDGVIFADEARQNAGELVPHGLHQQGEVPQKKFSHGPLVFDEDDLGTEDDISFWIGVVTQYMTPDGEPSPLNKQPAITPTWMCGSWIALVPDMVTTSFQGSGPLSNILRAFGTVILRTVSPSRVTVSIMVSRYSGALKRFRKSIENPGEVSHEEMLVCSMCLALIEVSHIQYTISESSIFMLNKGRPSR